MANLSPGLTERPVLAILISGVVTQPAGAATHVVPFPELTAAPANDTCAGAQILPDGPYPVLSSIVDITDATDTGNPPAPSCTGPQPKSVWYRFTPSVTSFYRLSTCADAPTATTVDGTTLAIYTSAGGCVGCGQGGCNSETGQALVSTQLSAGTDYFILIGEFNAGLLPVPAVVQLRIDRVPSSPANDTCAGAIPLTLNTPVTGTTISGTDDYQLAAGSACFVGASQAPSTAVGQDTVYAFTAPTPGIYAIRVLGEPTSVNLVLYNSIECPAATPGIPVIVECDRATNRGAPTRAEQLHVPMIADQTIFVYVDDSAELSQYMGTNYRIEARLVVPESEPNDTPATADAQVCGIQQVLGTEGDVDFFTLGTPAANSRLFAFVDGSAVNSFNTNLRVTTATGTLEHDRDNASLPFGSLQPSIAGTILNAVPSFLRLNQDEANEILGAYRLYSVVQPADTAAVAESEPNGTIALADEGVRNYFSGSLAGPAPSLDIDLYQTSVAAGDEVFVSLDGDPLRNNTPINAKLALLDAAGNVLVQVNDGGSTSSTTSGAGSLTATTPFSPSEGLVYRFAQGGTAYVRVESGTTSTSSTGAGDYLLSIARNCLTGGGAFLVDGFESADTTSWSATVPPP